MSAVFKTYDVLGWISPTILLMKFLIQGLWKTGHGWDDAAPEEALKAHQDWREELPVLAQKTIPRCYVKPGYVTLSLHGFAEAVVYCRATYPDHPPTTSLVTSKTKLAKLENSTIPRLELCAALLLAKLLSSVGKTVDIPANKWYAWSDSSIVLAWLDGNPRQHPVYVSNRVRQTLAPYIWHYVPTACNPADCASRGLKPTELLNHTLWWEGPPWLKEEPLPIPKQPPRRPLPDAGPPVCAIQQVSSVTEQISNSQLSYPSIISTAAWCQRFLQRLQHGKPDPDTRSKVLTGAERRTAEQWLFREAQARSFPRDISSLQKSRPLSRDSHLKNLNPFIDDHHLIRVGGRLSKSELAPSQQHPIILDGRDPLMAKFFLYLHHSLCHCGPSLLLCSAGTKLHILGARRLSRRTCSQCVTCRRHRPQTQHQLMGELPSQRVNHNGPPFTHTGMDYAGPFTLKLGRVRKPVKVEAYICVFVCMATKAVHLEVVSDQTTAAFQAALQRFVARRGCPDHLYSDNGANFVGARNDLHSLYSFLQDQKNSTTIQHYLATHFNVTWHNIPPRSPHMGGLWEAAVKSMKTHLRRVIGSTLLTFEELTTISCRVEACLNSRPLLPLHSHNTDGLDVLTPGHFLISKSPSAYPEDPTPAERPHLLRKWRQCQAMAHHLWTRWSKEYLNSLQARSKWQTNKPSLQVDDIVIIRPHQHFFSCHWPLGRITKILPGKDNLVRVVELKTANGLFQRAVTQLSLLFRPGEEESSQQQDTDPAPPPSLSRQE